MLSLLMSGEFEYSVMVICIGIIVCFINAVSCVLKTKVSARKLSNHCKIFKKKNMVVKCTYFTKRKLGGAGKVSTRADHLHVGVSLTTAGWTGPTPYGLSHARDMV